MDTSATATGLGSVLPGDTGNQQANFWRPWTGKASGADAHNPRAVLGGLFDAKLSKPPQVVHPVKLFWPKSRCFDYLYREAETLLRNYPVQATICPYDDSSSDEDSDEEEDESEKELN
ncbi:protein ripply2-like [Betta splendens]|uniref:Protein ripply2-like n=1 Tax=Betta splendens TaxID=158456 RepID=A0A6P7LV82_BETSP|nr:protein ripply2-like [Betta splendens]XP_055362543.1 protein ripply2-like [Betta splendens]